MWGVAAHVTLVIGLLIVRVPTSTVLPLATMLTTAVVGSAASWALCSMQFSQWTSWNQILHPTAAWCSWMLFSHFVLDTAAMLARGAKGSWGMLLHHIMGAWVMGGVLVMRHGSVYLLWLFTAELSTPFLEAAKMAHRRGLTGLATGLGVALVLLFLAVRVVSPALMLWHLHSHRHSMWGSQARSVYYQSLLVLHPVFCALNCNWLYQLLRRLVLRLRSKSR